MGLQKLFETIFSLPIAIWTSTPSFADMAMLSEDFNAEKMPEITHFYFDGEVDCQKTAQKLRQRFPRSTYYQCLHQLKQLSPYQQ